MRISALCLVPFLLVACTNEQEDSTGGSGSQDPVTQGEGAGDGNGASQLTSLEITEPEVHDAMCGCVLPSVKRCGNYVKLEEQWVEVKHPSLGVMEWCKNKKAGAKIKVAGKIEDGKFVASELETLE